jgi:hypothetical protein
MYSLEMHSLRLKVERELATRLVSVGWNEVVSEGGQFVRPGSDDIFCHFSMNVAERSNSLGMTPALGVRHGLTSQLVSEFKGNARTSAIAPSTYGRGLMDLVIEGDHSQWGPPSRRWLISSVADVGEKVELLQRDLETYGLPFYGSFSTLNEVIHRLQHMRRAQINSEHLAVACAVLGRTEDASTALAECVAEAKTQVAPMSTQSWRFIKSFIAYFGVSDSSLNSEFPE